MSNTLLAQDVTDLVKKGNLIQSGHEENVGPASYLLTIGSYKEPGRAENRSVNLLKKGQGVVLRPHGSLLVGVIETVNMPNDMIGYLTLRSSYARGGLLPWGQGFVEPGYKGSITLMLYNGSGDYMPLVGGEQACHLILQNLDKATSAPYQGPYGDTDSATGDRERGNWNIVGSVGRVLTEGAAAASREFGKGFGGGMF